MAAFCPHCGEAAPALSEQARVKVLSRRALAELLIFLGTAGSVALACWGTVWLIKAVPRWRGHSSAAIYRSTRRDGPDYYLRSAILQTTAPLQPLGLDALLAYPIREPGDVARVFEAAAGPKDSICPRVELLPFSDALHRTTGCLIASVVDTRQTPYSIWLIDFAQSTNRVLRTLRNELGVPPPVGHAVIRVFEPGDPQPAPLQEFHQRSPEIAGAAFGGPYVAIFDSTSDIDSVLGHELVHAYMNTAMGRRAGDLPAWFHEGIALSLARTPLATTTERGSDLRLTSLTAQYQEYKHVFDRAESRLGRKRYLALLRQCIATYSPRPLLTATQSKDYADLRRFAGAWVLSDLVPYLLMLLAGLLVAVLNLVRRRRAQA
jgi:predicted secreted Zn-dependent protease